MVRSFCLKIYHISIVLVFFPFTIIFLLYFLSFCFSSLVFSLLMPSRTSADTNITHLHTTPRVHHNILNFIHCATAQIVLSLALLPLLVQFCVIANQKNRLAKITCQFFLFCTTARILSGCRNKTLHSKLYINIKLFPLLKIWCWKFLYITLNQKLLPENHEPWSQNNQILHIL